MNYKNFADLEVVILSNLHRLPKEIGLIVGVPRSGILPASILALQLNIPFTDVLGFKSRRIFDSGRRLILNEHEKTINEAKKILVIDDSVASGREINRIKAILSKDKHAGKIIYSAVFVAEDKTQDVDFYFDICPLPRVFSWNIFHHSSLKNACVDIDGVLCVDPTNEENDDADNYRKFILHAKPLFLPSVEIGALVSSRLEKYREETVKWLAVHNVKYRELHLLNLKSKEERQKLCSHGKYKGEIILNLEWADYFIESAAWQAEAIADISMKPVICTQNNKLYMPSGKALSCGAIKKAPRKIKNKIDRIKKLSYNKMLEWNRW